MKSNPQSAPALPQQPARPHAAVDRGPKQPAPSASAMAAGNSLKVDGQATDGDYPTLPPSRRYRGAHRRWISQSTPE